MQQTCEAVYEKGVFKPVVQPPDMTDGQHVRLSFDADEKPSDQKVDVLALMAQVYDGLTADEIDEIEKLILDRRDFFGRPAPEF